MQTINSGLKVTGDLETRLLRVLARYCLPLQSTTGQSPAMLLMSHQMRTRFQNCKEGERRNNAENKPKRQNICMKPDTKGKRPSAMPLTGEIAAQEHPKAIDDVTMSESRTTFPTSNGSSCWSSGEGPMDFSWWH